MSRVFLTMAMSLDGFITGPHDDAENPAGINGMRLMDWLNTGDETTPGEPPSDDGNDDGGGGGEQWRPKDPVNQIVFDEMLATGAVITGRRTGSFAGYWGGDHHNGVPVFVRTHQAPDENPYERVHFVTDGIGQCVRQAKDAASDRDVMLHGSLHRPRSPQGRCARQHRAPAPAAPPRARQATVRGPPARSRRPRAGPHAAGTRHPPPALRRAALTTTEHP